MNLEGWKKQNKTRLETVCIVLLCVLQRAPVPKHVQHCVIASCRECFTTGPSFLALFHCAVWVLTANCIHCLILKPPAGSFQALWHVFPSLSQVQVGPLSAVPRHRLVPRLSASLTPAEGPWADWWTEKINQLLLPEEIPTPPSGLMQIHRWIYNYYCVCESSTVFYWGFLTGWKTEGQPQSRWRTVNPKVAKKEKLCYLIAPKGFDLWSRSELDNIFSRQWAKYPSIFPIALIVTQYQYIFPLASGLSRKGGLLRLAKEKLNIK